jgi:hypothetical protein
MRLGLCDVLKDPRGKLLRLFTAAELGTLIAGIDKVDVGDWEAHATYYGASVSLLKFCMELASVSLHTRSTYNKQTTPPSRHRSSGSGPWCAA